MTPEGRVKALVKRALATLPRRYHHMPVMNGMGAPALDFWVCVNGYFIGIETKAPGKDATPRQETTMDAVRLAGGRVYVVDGPESCEAMMQELRRL